MPPVSFFAWPFNDPRQYSIPDVINGNQVLWTRPSYSKTPLSFISQKEKPVISGDFPRSVCSSTFSCHFPPPQIHGLRHSQPCSNRADQIKKAKRPPLYTPLYCSLPILFICPLHLTDCRSRCPNSLHPCFSYLPERIWFLSLLSTLLSHARPGLV